MKAPKRPTTPKTILTAAEARRYLVGHHGLARRQKGRRAAVIALLKNRRCIQLDPLDPIGTNADLVALARIDGIARRDIYRHLYPGHAFEHFAKERCLLPPAAFPWYRDQAAETPWWRLSERKRRLDPALVQAVLDEIAERGPLTAKDLTDRGKVKPLSWNGWKGTSSAASMAIEVLWTQCKIVVCGREGGRKRYDIPSRALPEVHAEARERSHGDFSRWALLERVEAAGLLSFASGPHWSMLSSTRTSELPATLVAEGKLEEVGVEGSPRRYLAPAGFRNRTYPAPDGEMRILGPLDPLLWDRELVRTAFGFDYVWEVYKPASLRRWGWYVCPLLQKDRLVGRLEGTVEGPELRINKIWREQGVALDESALAEALSRHARACGAEKVRLPRRRL